MPAPNVPALAMMVPLLVMLPAPVPVIVDVLSAMIPNATKFGPDAMIVPLLAMPPPETCEL